MTALHRFLVSRLTRLAACWAICLLVAGGRWHHAYHCFDSPRTTNDSTAAEMDRVRVDKNNGHTWIDFGGQYVFGRTAADGHWRRLYDRDILRSTATAAYPLDLQSPGIQKYHTHPDTRPPDLGADDVKPDADRLLTSMIGEDHETARNQRLADVLGPSLSGDPGNPLAAVAGLAVGLEQLEADRNSEKTRLGRPLIGGPLYPPVHALLYAPLGTVRDTQLAYRLFQLLSVASVFGAGLAVRFLSQGRVWWPVATVILFVMPGMRPGLDLGQNHAITLCIVLTGWAIAARASEFGGGMVWGLLAFKPVWGLAFILAPVLLRKWRFVAGTAVGGISLCLTTLPLVGVEGWRNWLTVGQEAAAMYNTDVNWINLSRDVSGIPKRLFTDFSQPQPTGGDPWINGVSNGLLGAVGLLSAAIGAFGGDTLPRALRIARRRGMGAAVRDFLSGRGTSYVGLRAGFVLIGGFLCCYRFMYYDAVLCSVGLAALFAHPRWTLAGWRGELRMASQPPTARRVFALVNSAPLTLLVLIALADNVFLYSGMQATLANDKFLKEVPDTANTGAATERNAAGTTKPKTKWVPRDISLKFDYCHPVDTFFVLGFWAWCGWALLTRGDRERRPPPSCRATSSPP
ncbi:MAG: DUF2029 domain-containing protein [Fimbriiglobus sp.]|nr:DUF2029 domain-containing protein [Fimbriiglobus sp.]